MKKDKKEEGRSLMGKISARFLTFFSFISNYLPSRKKVVKRYLKSSEDCYCGSKRKYFKCHKFKDKAKKKRAIVISKISKNGDVKEKFGFVSTEPRKPTRLVPEGFTDTGIDPTHLA